MKKLTTILLIGITSATCFCQTQDYATTETDLKQRSEFANGKVVTGAILIGLGIAVINSADKSDAKDFLNRSGGGSVGSGAVIMTSGIIEKIEIAKEKRGRKKAKDYKQPKD